MMNSLTHTQARALAAFIHSIRGDWDKPGIEHALGKAREMAPGPDLAIAAIKAAKLAGNRTPSVIGMEGPHWRGSESTPRRETPPRHETCSVCYQQQAVCRHRWTGDHEFMPLARPHAEDVTDHVAQLRQIHDETRAELCGHGVRRANCLEHRAEETTDA